VAFFYVQHNDPRLKQGEIISNLNELRLQIPEAKNISTILAKKDVKFDSLEHPYVMVVSQDCDLEQDYGARFSTVAEDKLLRHILVCALFVQDELKGRTNKLTGRKIINSELWKRIRQNQDERYHYLIEAPIEGTGNTIPELIADFKTTFSLPTEFVYWMISTGDATRKGVLCSPYLEDLMHRLYTFLGRVATPEVSGES
jgi:hypothetical protein